MSKKSEIPTISSRESFLKKGGRIAARMLLLAIFALPGCAESPKKHEQIGIEKAHREKKRPVRVEVRTPGFHIRINVRK